MDHRDYKALTDKLDHAHELLHGLDSTLKSLCLEVSNLHRKVNEMAKTMPELAADLKAVTAQIAKIGTETAKTLQQVTDLQALLAAGGNTTPEVDAALTALKAQAQLTDDLVPDAPTP